MSAHDDQTQNTSELPSKPIRPRSLTLLGEGDGGSPPSPFTDADPGLWRSLEEREQKIAGDPALARAIAQEFPAGADQLEGVNRRNFIQLLGASLAVTGAACYRPNPNIVPYVKRPPEVTPGNALHFASSFSLEGYATGLVVKSLGGRPVKIEGNPDHPDSQGTTGLFEQALTLGLYDDERGKALRHQGKGIAWRTLLRLVADSEERLGADGGAKLRFLVEPNSSPLLADMRTRILQKYPRAKFVAFSGLNNDAAVEGSALAFGRALEPRHDLTRAKVIVSLDADFLSDGPEQTRLSRQFGKVRDPGPDMTRLYVAEPCPTNTGTMADHRLRLRGSEIPTLAQALAAALSKGPGGEALAELGNLPAGPGTIDGRWVGALAKDLLANRGRSVVLAGRRQPAVVHALAAAINVALGNVGSTVSYWAASTPDHVSGIEPLRTLVEEIAAGQVDTLVITAENPVYTAPSDFKLAKLLERVPHVLYLGNTEDDTALLAETYVPRTHVLETWGDGQALDGTVSLIQPLLEPLWMSHSDSELYAAFLGEGDKGGLALLKAYWQRRAVAEGRASVLDFDAVWEAWLGKGIIEKTSGQAESAPRLDGAALAAKLTPAMSGLPRGGAFELGFVVDPKVFDGRYANNAWLQELAHPITKMTWDNAVIISKTSADELGVRSGDVVRIALGDREVEGPIIVQPGHADQALTVSLGYGQSYGAVGKGVGFNAGLVRTSRAPWFDLGATVAKTGKRHIFGITQVHWQMEHRDPVLSATLTEIQEKDSEIREKLAEQRAPVLTIHTPVDYSKQAYKWAMSIDLNKCDGCNVCVVACVSENNIPVVGRENVRVGREMAWIRVDRYYSGSAEEPEMLTQPVACVHCETAPCEYVCPVNATAHSDEGLNEMVYNRCIGTRYCSNNCPYKARRFNFLDYHEEVSPVGKMIANPDVTVRSRGVMEKCTYCVQRIERARIDSRVEGRTIKDGEIQTACQQACPTGAIEFGSLNDPNSRVSKSHEDVRRYDLLHDLGTRPRTAYLARVRNPNPELA